MNHFWRWARDETTPDERTLYMEGVIAEESWWDDDITPDAFKSELYAGTGPVTLVINSPGGDTIAASQIYTMLKDYPGSITAKITGIAASAASVVAMAGDKVSMSPTSMLMIHNPYTCAMGDSEEMRKAGQLLDEVKESIINAYQLKTGLLRSRISQMMDDETWMNPIKAKELGFCDEILYQNNEELPDQGESMFFSSASVERRVMNSLLAKTKSGVAADRTTAQEAVNAATQAESEQAVEVIDSNEEPHTEPAAGPVDAAPEPNKEVPENEATDAGVTVDAAADHSNTDTPAEPENTEGTEGPDVSADAEAQRIRADSLYQRLSLLKYSY